MNSFIEYLTYISVRVFGAFVRLLPLSLALKLGRCIGRIGYYLDAKHRAMAYSNLKVAFVRKKTPRAIRRVTKGAFENYGQCLMELLRLPLVKPERLNEVVEIKGREHVEACLKKGKGVLLVAMHFGSWELANLACASLSPHYKVVVKPQKKFLKLDELLNSYRAWGGSVSVSRGLGTRDIIRSLHNNEVVGMVVDQGGKDGIRVPFFGRPASLSVGAIRLGLKFEVPVCFCVILRTSEAKHCMLIHEPMTLAKTGDTEKDVVTNLSCIVKTMEKYIEEHPADYMWFYKIWKYSSESTTVILSDGKTGHLRQSQTVAAMLEKALAERGIRTQPAVLDITFKNRWAPRILSVLSIFLNRSFCQGRISLLKWFVTPGCFQQILDVKTDFVISCGSSLAGVNFILSSDHHAKSLVVLKPGLLGFRKFNLVVLPQHDWPPGKSPQGRVVITKAAPNLITPEYLKDQAEKLLGRFAHLKNRNRMRIGLLLGGNTKGLVLGEQLVKLVIHQIREAADELNADILMTTSRRTRPRIEDLVQREMKNCSRCMMLIIANRNNVPEAVGGILGLSDIVIVSGESVSMISEAVSSGKSTIVFSLKDMGRKRPPNKYDAFSARLSEQGHAVLTDAKNIRPFILDMGRHKLKTTGCRDQETILEGVRKII